MWIMTKNGWKQLNTKAIAMPALESRSRWYLAELPKSRDVNENKPHYRHLEERWQAAGLQA